jgi:uncharacterized protein (DUF427 family)
LSTNLSSGEPRSYLPSEGDSVMVKAVWNGATIAESDETIVVEGNHYFPRDAVDTSLLRESDTHSICPWKGTASYYSLVVDGAENRDAAWYYPETRPAAAEIRGRIAFWKGVQVG